LPTLIFPLHIISFHRGSKDPLVSARLWSLYQPWLLCKQSHWGKWN